MTDTGFFRPAGFARHPTTTERVVNMKTAGGEIGGSIQRRSLHSARASLQLQVNEFYQKGCQEKSSASTGGEMFSRDPAHWN